MEKTKSISNLVTDKETETEHLRYLKVLFNQACIKEFGYDLKTIHQKLDRQNLYDQRLTKTHGQIATFSVDEN